MIPMQPIKKMTPGEFRELGYLQELNRNFLHPLGLALEMNVDANGVEHFGHVWDYRDDPEGLIFGPGIIDREKAERISQEFDEKWDVRSLKFGWSTQPVGGTEETQ